MKRVILLHGLDGLNRAFKAEQVFKDFKVLDFKESRTGEDYFFVTIEVDVKLMINLTRQKLITDLLDIENLGL